MDKSRVTERIEAYKPPPLTDLTIEFVEWIPKALSEEKISYLDHSCWDINPYGNNEFLDTQQLFIYWFENVKGK